MNAMHIPAFSPARWLSGGHRQTLAGFWLPQSRVPYTACQHRVILPDGDCLVLHDDRPPQWQVGGPTALLVHGICGSHASNYMTRAAAKLQERGVRVFRMDQRACGASRGLARRPYHAGGSGDVAFALRRIARLCPGSATSLVGFSMGGHIALKLAGEFPEAVPANLCSVMAVNPPIDLTVSAAALRRPRNRFYDCFFVRYLRQIVEGLHKACRRFRQKPIQAPRFRSLHEFNQFFFTRVWKFESLENYYSVCSSAPFLSRIRIPTLVVASADDPVVPVKCFERARLSRATRLVITERGGHLGFIAGTNSADPDRYWIDWRVVDWVTLPWLRPGAMELRN